MNKQPSTALWSGIFIFIAVLCFGPSAFSKSCESIFDSVSQTRSNSATILNSLPERNRLDPNEDQLEAIETAHKLGLAVPYSFKEIRAKYVLLRKAELNSVQIRALMEAKVVGDFIKVRGFTNVYFRGNKVWVGNEMLLGDYLIDAEGNLYNKFGYEVTKFVGTGMGPDVYFDRTKRYNPSTGVVYTVAGKFETAGVDSNGYLVLDGHRANAYGSGFSIVDGQINYPDGKRRVKSISKYGDSWKLVWEQRGWF